MRPPPDALTAAPRVVDTHIGDGLAIRLLDPPTDALAQVKSEAGGMPSAPDVEARSDVVLTVRFVERIDHGPLQTLGLTGDSFAFDTDGFFVRVRGRHLARIDFAALDDAEILVERGAGTVPLLIPLLGLRLLARGRMLLHASSYIVDGRAIVATGWQSGGKSELLLAFMKHGATYISDEWTMLDGEGRIGGLHSDVHVWDWQLRQWPGFDGRLGGADRGRLALLRAARGVTRRSRGMSVPGPVRRSLHQLDGWVANASRVRLDPETAFGGRVRRDAINADAIVLASVATGPTSVKVTDGATIAARMAASLEYERGALLRAWAQCRYAFPGVRSALMEDAPRMERDLLARALAGLPATEILHPYPPSLEDLYEAVVGFDGEAPSPVRGPVSTRTPNASITSPAVASASRCRRIRARTGMPSSAGRGRR